MRVLEGEIITTYTMGKNKKHRLRKSKENEGGSDTSDEGAAAPVGCPHINKSVNFAAMRKAFLKSTCGECVACNKDNKGSNKESSGGATAVTTETDDFIDNETTIWVCLQCGNQGCDRNSKEKHALKHYETPHSQCHCITVNLTTWACWCYTCDDDVVVENSKRIQECVEFLRKQSGLPRSDQTSSSARRPLSVLNTSQPKVEPSPESTKEKSRQVIPKASSSVVCLKVKGLCNLGNTCFFNAVMQSLSQSHSLEPLLIERTEKGKLLRLPGHTIIDVESSGSSEEDEDDITNKELPNIDIVPVEAGPLTQSLLGFLQDMNKTGSKSSSNNIVNPSPLFGQICKKAPRFKGFQQQDSHELLRYLLDVVRTEEIKRCQTGILKKFNVNPKTVDDETKMKVKEYGRQAKHTFIDSLFGGQLVSTVICEECKHISQIFEPFLDLSLPVTEEKPSRPNSMIGTKKKSIDEIEDSSTKAVDGFAAKDKPTKQPSRKEKRMSKKEQRRKEKLARKSSKQEDPSFNDIVKDTNLEEGKGSDEGPISDGRISESAENEKEEKEDDHENSDADIEDNLENDTSKLFGGASANVTLLGQENMNGTDTIADPSIDSSNNLISLNQTNPELQNGLTVTESLQCLPIVRTDYNNDSNIDADSSSVTLVDNESSTLFTSTESSLTPSTTGSSYKTRSTDSSRSSTCDIKDTVDGNCLRRGLSESLNELHLEDSRNRLGATGNDLVPDLTKKLNYLNLDMCHYPTNTDDIPYIDADESPEAIKRSSLPLIHQEEETPVAVDCNGLSRRNSHYQKTRQALRKEAQYKSMATLSPRYHSVGKECSIASCLHQFTSAELLTGSNKVTCDNCTKIKMKKLPNKDKKKSDSVCSNANKQYLIFQPPAVLTLHLKRFEQIGFASRKVNRHVEFPLLLDLAPYCSSLCQGVEPGQKKVLYSLYGVVEHSGRLSGGHYTAFVKVRPNMNSVVSFIHPNFTFPKEYIHRYVERSLNGPKSPDIDISDKTIESLVPPGKWYHISDSHVHEVSESSVLHAQAYLLFYERIY